jgi:predicted transcriptional regulator
VASEHVFSVEESCDVFYTSQQVSQWTLPKAVVVSLSEATVELSNKEANVRVLVTDLFGRPISSAAQVMLVRALDSKAQSILANQEVCRRLCVCVCVCVCV